MTKGRVEAFSDGMFAIIITVMVLQLPAPHGSGISALQPLTPVFLGYFVSYLYVGALSWAAIACPISAHYVAPARPPD